MNSIKSHFVFSKAQRSGIFLLIVVIIVLQFVYYFVSRPSGIIHIDQEALLCYEAEIDSLRHVKTTHNTYKIRPFNPNYISDYKGAMLGLSITEIDRLLAYRQKNKWINSSKDFQNVTGISDALLDRLAPYFKFPKYKFSSKLYKGGGAGDKNNAPKYDLNTATVETLQKVYGLGAVLSKRIVNYRARFDGGFADMIELREVYGLSDQVIKTISTKFEIKTPRVLKTYNLNTATVEELVTLQYIDYEIAYAIIEYRTLHEGFTSISELSKVNGIPASKIDLIKLSLQIK